MLMHDRSMEAMCRSKNKIHVENVTRPNNMHAGGGLINKNRKFHQLKKKKTTNNKLKVIKVLTPT